MRIARSFLAVLIGYSVFLLIVRMLNSFARPDADGAALNYLLVSISVTVAAAILAGYLTARIATSHEFPHAAGVGLLMVVVSFVSMRQEGIAHPGWYETTIAGCGPISAMLGAALRLLTKKRR